MTVALMYMKSTFALDVVATLPQVASFMDAKFVVWKLIRLYMIAKLHYPLEFLIQSCLSSSDDHVVTVLNFAASVICKIVVLMHYLACIWLFIGSDYFLNHEEGYLPWRLANADFSGMERHQLLIFANYWICTAVTTVGYGDYSGGTTLEYQFVTLVEFLGFILFAAL